MHFPALTRLAWHTAKAILLRRRLSFRGEAQEITAHLDPALVLLGRENIPQAGPAVITMNHYAQPGFQALWLALAISATVPVEIHWIMTAAWTDKRWWKSFWWTPFTGWVFKKVAEVFEFTTMPPMPPDPDQAAWRAQSVRQVLRFIRTCRDETGNTRALIGLAPEGGDARDGLLSHPPPGSGRFIEQMIDYGLLIHPVGVFIDKRGLCVNFGPAYQPERAENASRADRDRQISNQVMERIAVLLPVALRGGFQD